MLDILMHTGNPRAGLYLPSLPVALSLSYPGLPNLTLITGAGRCPDSALYLTPSYT